MQAMAHSEGSYRYNRFQNRSEELDRLKMQARIALSIEQEIWRQAGLRVGMTVLDLACGPGATSCELAKRVTPGGKVIGVDINPGLIEVAEQIRLTDPLENVSFRVGNAYALDLPPATFDFVYARFLFQHLENPRDALRTVHRVLKPGGILCVLDIDDAWTSFSPASAAFRTFIRKSGAGQKRRGGNREIGSRLYGLLHDAGFQKVATRIYPVTTADIGVRNFLGLAVLFRLELLGRFRKLLLLRQLKKIKAASGHEAAWGALGIFVATGAVPCPRNSDRYDDS